MDPAALLDAYRRDRRALELPGFCREDLGDLIRFTPLGGDAEGAIAFTTVPTARIDAEIRRQVAYFRELQIGFEWKVYGSDEPPDLRARLASCGFEAGDPEVLMVQDVETFEPRVESGIPGIELRRIADTGAIPAIVELQERNWGRAFAWLPDHLRSLWDRASFYGAYRQDGLIGMGWIEYASGSPFAEIHGGAVLREWRGRGIYSRLLEARMADALERRVPWVAVDAAPMSRPILDAKGFVRLDETCPMTWAPRNTLPAAG